MNFKKIGFFSVVIIVALLVGAFSLNQYSAYVSEKATSKEATKKAEQDAAKIEEEAKLKEEEEARIKAEEEARLKEEEEARKKAEENKALIEERTYYTGKKGAEIYDTYKDEKTVIGGLKAKTPIFIEEFIKNENGEIIYVRALDGFEGENIGVIKFNQLVKVPMDLILQPYADADYSPFERHRAYESNPPVAVKGVYVTGHSASGEKIDKLIDLIERTELNSFVIDVKDDNGFLLFYSETAEKYNPKANERVYIKDMEAFMKRLKEKNIYLIARIVTFKSPIYAKENPDKAIVYKGNNQLYSDADGLIWASPHNRELWDYNIGVAKEAAKWGFNEIQFDYVRFPAISNKERIEFRNVENESQTATIQSFLKTAYRELSKHEVYISADVFGWAATSINDVGIGQHWEAITNVVDYICPMMYPSHYGPNNFGLSVPDAYPYETIDRSIKDAFDRNSNVLTPGVIRPWIQDFTARWVKGYIPYGPNEVNAQIKALEDNGIHEFLLWNAKNNYSESAFE